MGRIKHFERIRDPRSFDAIYKNADKVWHSPYFVLFFLRDDALHQVGFVAGKKVGNAVRRNKAKRLLRAHFLTYIDTLASGSYIFVARPKILEDDFDTVSVAFKNGIGRSGALLSKR